MKTIGIIGTGSIGGRHERNLRSLGHVVLAYDPARPINNNDFALSKLLEESDAIIIASPTSTHYDYIKKCDGKPTFVEKPIYSEEGMAPIRNDIDFNSVVMVGYNLRFHSCVIQAKEWLQQGHLGNILWANFVVAQKNTKYRDHVILNWSHEIDLALYLLGPGGATAAMGNDKIADLCIEHQSGAYSTVHLDYVTEPEIRQFVIVGQDATLIADLVNRQAWLRNSKGTVIDHHEGDDSWDSNYKDEMETFIARLDGQETVGCTGAEALEVLKICLKAKSLQSL
jgi:predicted dehydrogenase